MSSADPCSSKKRPREEAEDVSDEVMEEADSLKKAREEEEDVKEYDASEDLFESQEKELKSETEAGGGGGEPSKTTSEAAPLNQEAEADKDLPPADTATQAKEPSPEDPPTPSHDEMAANTGRGLSWRGSPLGLLTTYRSFPPPRPAARGGRSVFVEWPPNASAGGGAAVRLRPHPAVPQRDRWDEGHVRMPFSDQNLFPLPSSGGGRGRGGGWHGGGGGGGGTVVRRWPLVLRALSESRISSVRQLQDRVMQYNNKRWNFDGLRRYVEEDMSEEEQDLLFETVLPEISRLCISSQSVLTQPIPLLRRMRGGGADEDADNSSDPDVSVRSLTFSQSQVAALLANSFFCTWPRRNTAVGRGGAEYSNFPDINFNRLFSDLGGDPTQPEKLKCIFNYFRIISQRDSVSNTPCAPQEGLVTYERRAVNRRAMPDWGRSGIPLLSGTKLHIDSEGTIEDDGFAMLQVDFANRFVGGGVLSHGCVQEEIRFLVCPELIASRLFTERLEDNECLVVTGVERFSDYQGYSRTFRFAGVHRDATPVDPGSLHRLTRIVAVDAIPFRRAEEQYRPELIDRELNKAYVGFYSAGEPLRTAAAAAVATGNWGCGAFGGDPRLKFLLQLMAAVQCRRDICYFTFGDQELRDGAFELIQALENRGGGSPVTVGELYTAVCSYSEERSGSEDVFGHVLKALSYDAATDEEDWGGGEEDEAILEAAESCEKREEGDDKKEPSLKLTLREKEEEKPCSNGHVKKEVNTKRPDSGLSKMEQDVKEEKKDSPAPPAEDPAERRTSPRKKQQQKTMTDYFSPKSSL